MKMIMRFNRTVFFLISTSKLLHTDPNSLKRINLTFFCKIEDIRNISDKKEKRHFYIACVN